VLFFLYQNLFSQGFDWQTSARMPSLHPTIFFGGVLSAGYLQDFGSFDFSQTYIKCAEFKNGLGSNINVGIKAEYWLTSLLAINGAMKYNIYNSTFTDEQSFRAIDEQGEFDKKYKYTYSPSLAYISFNSELKWRFIPTHFFLSAGITYESMVTNDNEFAEEVISPAELTFSDGTQKHIIAYGQIAPINNSIIQINLKTGTDFNLGNKRYGSIALKIDLPINNVIKDDSWRRLVIGAELSIYQGFLEK